MICKYSNITAFALALILAAAASPAQNKKRSSRKSHNELANRVIKAKADVVSAAKDYKSSLEKLLGFLETDVKSAAETVERRRAYYAQSVISMRELEESEQALVLAQAKLAETKKQIIETESLIAEASAAEQIAKLPPIPSGGYRTTAALIRYNGPGAWSLFEAGKVQNFFLARFGRSLPVSAFGQTPVHDRLGFDHRNAIDVALHPDSPEGQAIMAYLRGAGISFIAFRQAVAGSATGAHIHVGHPSRRIAR